MNRTQSPEKGTETPEVEVVNRQQAPKVSVKVERKKNLEDYNSVTAQVFYSSGTLEEYRGQLLNEEGEMKEEVAKDINQITEELQNLATNRVIDAIKRHAKAEIEVEE